MYVDVERHGAFRLDEDFVESYRRRPVAWGFGALSWVTYKRTYSRGGESWWETCRRVVEGMFTIERAHCLELGIHWHEDDARDRAKDAFERLWRFQWTPPGRGLWMMGTRYVYERGGAALNNCGFISTRDIDRSYAEPFLFMLDMSMLGVGVGFDTRGKGALTIARPSRSEDVHRIEDSREGWAAAMGRLLRAYAGEGSLPRRWDYSAIRPRGASLESFGGTASGPEPLENLLIGLEELHESYVGRRVDARLIVDTMNLAGRCVVAGGIRRSAQIAFGDPTDAQFLDLKQDPEKLRAYRWASNNSVFAELGMDYAEVARRSAVNGEPGFFWLDNARAFGRMKDARNDRDEEALGSNPCVEQTLWDRELCCLVETYPAHHDSIQDYLRTLDVAFRYAKVVTLVPTHDARTNVVMARNRRIGCSMTGVVQAISRHGYRSFLEWCDEAYGHVQRLDEVYSARWRVPRSIKTTSVKPSGTVSILAGATPGVHWEHAPYYVRRLRLRDDHPLVEACREAGYGLEPDRYSPGTTVVAFPVHIPGLERPKSSVSVWEKVDLAAQMQRYWSDNQVSCTAEFDPHREAADLPRILTAYEDRLKALVFLPAAGHGYEQPPYEAIAGEDYQAMRAGLRPLRGEIPHEEELEARFCEGTICEIP